jgi:acetoin utilization deacetylase AcuC-like enzyme
MTPLTLIEQRDGVTGSVAWVVEHGHPVLAREDSRRLCELRRGLLRHPRVRVEAATTSDETVECTLQKLHDQNYLDALRQIKGGESVVLPEFAAPGLAPDVPVSAGVVEVAREGARTAIAAAELVAAGGGNSYAVCRPPGHHAGPAWCGGYCYFNNAAAAAMALLDAGAGAVGILDLDVHYPNGTAAIVRPIAGVYLHSLHTLNDANAPARSAPTERERAIGFRQAPDAYSYLASISSSLRSLSRRTDVIVLSLGYDILRNDPHGCWGFSPAIFAQIGRVLAASRLSICIVQEGGYSLGRLAACSYAFASGLLAEGLQHRVAIDSPASPIWCSGARRVRSGARGVGLPL